MNQKTNLSRVQALSGMILDTRLSRMRAASAELERSRAQLRALDQTKGHPDLPLAAAELAELNYKRWADKRKGELNAVIARQTVDWLSVVDAAKVAFGRMEALQGLSTRLDKALSRKSGADH